MEEFRTMNREPLTMDGGEHIVWEKRLKTQKGTDILINRFVRLFHQ